MPRRSSVADLCELCGILTINGPQPVTVRDFMNYLIYVEHSAENLQFYLWYKDYVKRFHDANTDDISLAPEWTQSMEDEVITRIRKEQSEKVRPSPATDSMFTGTGFEKAAVEIPQSPTNPFNAASRSSQGESEAGSVFNSSQSMPSDGTNYKAQAADAFQAAGVKLPCEHRRFCPNPYSIEPQDY